MRILHVSDCYLPRLGGIEVQLASLARRQLDAGHQVEVATATPPRRHDRTRFHLVDGVPVHRITADLPFELPVHPRAGREVDALVTSADRAGRGFDAVHVHTGVISPFAYGAVPALLRHRLPVVLTVHSVWGPAGGLFRLADAAVHWSRWPVVLSAVSSVAARPLREIVGTRGSVRVIPNGIDPADWAADPLPRPPQEVLLAAVMRLAPRKRCRPLLRILREARAAVPASITLRAVIVGEGPERAGMQRYLRRQGMDWVQLPGRWSRERIRELYRRADVFVSAANLESFGIAALEARTAGLPVVAKARTGVAEFVADGVAGLLGDEDDDLVVALARLATDVQLRQRIAAHNRAQPPDATWPQVLAACDVAYADAAVRAGRRPAAGRAIDSAPD